MEDEDLRRRLGLLEASMLNKNSEVHIDGLLVNQPTCSLNPTYLHVTWCGTLSGCLVV